MTHPGGPTSQLVSPPIEACSGSIPMTRRGVVRRWSLRRLPLLLFFFSLGIALLLLGQGSGVSGTVIVGAPKFYYFNPDSTQVNFQELQQGIKTLFLASGLQVDFQPFAHFRDFHQQVKTGKPAFLLLPSWYLDRPDAPKDIAPMLIPVRQGLNTYTKLLMTSKSSRIDRRNLARKTIALTTFGSDEEAVLDKILFHRLGVTAAEMNYIHASKDLDALIGVAINQVELALVSRESVARLRQINPRLGDAVTSLAESDPIPLPVICYSRDRVTPEQLEAFKRVVQQEGDSPGSRTIKKILQIDDWKAITE